MNELIESRKLRPILSGGPFLACSRLASLDTTVVQRVSCCARSDVHSPLSKPSLLVTLTLKSSLGGKTDVAPWFLTCVGILHPFSGATGKLSNLIASIATTDVISAAAKWQPRHSVVPPPGKLQRMGRKTESSTYVEPN